MKTNRLFSTNEFAKFARTTRDTLLHYDQIGLLVPASRAANNYRYYSSRQLAIVNLIRTYQALGMSLGEIKELADFRTPALVDGTLGEQLERIDAKIEEWVRARKLLYTLKRTIHSVLDVDAQEISVQFLQAEAIVLGELNDYSGGRNDYDALYSFYHGCTEKYPDMDLNYSVWGEFSQDRLRRRDVKWPDRYYFANPEGLDRKPAGLYAIGYSYGAYGGAPPLYDRMFEYIEANGFEIAGPAFEEYPLNEICVLDEQDYMIRVMITVRQLDNR